MADLDFPYGFSSLGRTATTTRDDHIRDLIEQVLLTAPGERVMRPDFGAGLLALVFEPNSVTLAASTEMLVHSALLMNLGHLIAVAVGGGGRRRCRAARERGLFRAAGRHRPHRQRRRAGDGAMSFHCCDTRRLEALRRAGTVNAIDYLEVLDKALAADRAAPADPVRAAAAAGLFDHAGHDPYRRRRTYPHGRDRLVRARRCAAGPRPSRGWSIRSTTLTRTLVIRTDSSGDHSTYTLRLTANSGTDDPPARFRSAPLDDRLLVQGGVRGRL
jgi:hypothetical protein